MAPYRGIEAVDPDERTRHRVLVQVLWEKLRQQGCDDATLSAIDCVFFADDAASVEALLPAFAAWQCDVSRCEIPGDAYTIRATSPAVRLSENALRELADVALVAAQQSRCTFDGIEIDTAQLARRPWWRRLGGWPH